LNTAVDQRAGDAQPKPVVETSPLEELLKALWERTKQAGELIAQLREDKSGLQKRLGDLEQEVAELRRQVDQKEESLRKVSADLSRQAAKDAVLFTDGERQVLTNKVKELLAKLDLYA
jgi:predicted  nucleic acid-binding Zn-ribbon protein